MPRVTQVARTEQPFGTLPDGAVVPIVTLRNARGLEAEVVGYGATLRAWRLPGRDGRSVNVVLGAGTLADTLGGFPAAAAVVGRVANRIAGAAFTLRGREVKLVANERRHQLHGGPRGFAKQPWTVAPVAAGAPDAAHVTLTLSSPDGDQGYPGALDASVTYTLGDDDTLRIDYAVVCDQDTVVNLTNHAYFNLAGAGDVLGHELWLDAEGYTPTDRELIPTGDIATVRGTSLDFTNATPIGARIASLASWPGGYDHNLTLDAGRAPDAPVARLADPASGRTLVMTTTEPGVQLYSGNHFDGVMGVDGVRWPRHGGVCLETQHWPDAVHHPEFPSIVLHAGERFASTTTFAFHLS
jgi:aldose 1-epimerase